MHVLFQYQIVCMLHENENSLGFTFLSTQLQARCQNQSRYLTVGWDFWLEKKQMIQKLDKFEEVV